ncbi:MAG: hydrogenase formation protein HypD [Firmicutes bacterium]|nr:hydrogenase formation protein HypD [Bacillota bacterium]
MADLYEDKAIVAALATRIADRLGKPLVIMEVCGTHTMSIARSGLRSLLPPGLELISGPGCPVCVTDSSLISAALALARRPEITLATFGDMLRVPAEEYSLQSLREQGADVRLVLSPLDALELAAAEPQRQVVFFAVGFETTAPLTASTIEQAQELGLTNFSVLSAHKTMPAALRALLAGKTRVGGLLCPGHVAAVTGADEFAFVSRELGLPAAVAGFAPAEILLAVAAIVEMQENGRPELVNCYKRAVKPEGNPTARAVMERVFAPCDAAWRGLGLIPGSGLGLREEFAAFDAARRFAPIIAASPVYRDHPGCRCGDVLRGELRPADCPLFGAACTPRQPCGACMVSSEGSCAAAYRYREV